MERKVVVNVEDVTGKAPKYTVYKKITFADGIETNLFPNTSKEDAAMVPVAQANINFEVMVRLEQNGQYWNLKDIQPIQGAQPGVPTQAPPNSPQTAPQGQPAPHGLFQLGEQLSYFYCKALEDHKLDSKGVNDRADAAFDGWYRKLYGRPYVSLKERKEAAALAASGSEVDLGDDIPF